MKVFHCKFSSDYFYSDQVQNNFCLTVTKSGFVKRDLNKFNVTI